MAGRPTKYNEKVEEAICQALRFGGTRKASVESTGIDYQTFLNWMGSNSDFSTAVSRAEADAEMLFTKRVAHEATAAAGDWRAALEWLKRRRRVEWGDSIDVRKLDDDTILRLLTAAQGGGTEGTPAPGTE